MTTMVSHLPSVLLEEIFSRLNLKSLRAVRLTCKSWNILSRSGSFTNMYISRAGTRGEESMIIALIGNNLRLIKVVVVDPSIELNKKKEKNYIEFRRNPSFLDKEVKISQVFHCDGLLLCILEDNTDVVVLNPYRGETRWIKPRYSHRPYRLDMFSYALGYEDKKSGRSVKFLRFIDYFFNAPDKQFFWYEMYGFDSDSWTTLDVNPHWFIRFGDRGINLKGNTYWPAGAERNSSSEDHIVDRLICFDFTRERFGPLLPLPVRVSDHHYQYVTLSCVKEEKLAALFPHDESYPSYELEIWITTKIDVGMVSWSKFLKIDTEPDITVTSLVGGCFIDEENKVAMGFNENYPKTFSIIGENGYLRNLDIGVFGNQNGRPYVCCYVPSLVQIKRPAQGKRKTQSSLEKRRFAQNMLRLEPFEKAIEAFEKASLEAIYGGEKETR